MREYVTMAVTPASASVAAWVKSDASDTASMPLRSEEVRGIVVAARTRSISNDDFDDVSAGILEERRRGHGSRGTDRQHDAELPETQADDQTHGRSARR